MDRRGLAPLMVALFVALVSILGTASGTATAAGGEPAPTTQPDDETNAQPTSGPDDEPPVPTVSDFYPEDNNLSDCLGLVERPGCGSEARGGWRQTAVFVALAAGMGVIFWRVSVGVRRNRAALPTASSEHDDTPDPNDARP